MTSINVSNLVLNLQQKINNSTDEKDLLYYSKALQQLRTGQIFKVNTVSELPSNPTLVGSLYYVVNDELVYFFSSFGWTSLNITSVSPLSTWGVNSCGVLGNGTTVSSCSPVREICSALDWCQLGVGYRHNAAIKKSGQLWTWGRNCFGALGTGRAYESYSSCSPVREFYSATDWCQVGAGRNRVLAVKTSGQLWGWGRNCGALGDGTTTTKSVPVREISYSTDWCRVSSGSFHTIGLKTSGELWAWGLNTCGHLGNGSTINTCSPVREITSSTNWCSIKAGSYSPSAIKTDGSLWSWGRNLCGVLGDGTTANRCSPVRERCSDTDWCCVTGESFSTIAVKTSGQVWAWGRNNYGQLGNGTVTSICSPVRERCSATDWTSVSAYNTTLGLKSSGQIWSWGRNDNGQMGDGTVTSRCSPVREITSSTDWSIICHNFDVSSAIKTVNI